MAITVITQVETNESRYWMETFKKDTVPWASHSNFFLNLLNDYGRRLRSDSVTGAGTKPLSRTKVRTTNSVSLPSLHTYKTMRVQFKRKFRLKEPKAPKILQPLKIKVWKPVKPPVLQKGRKRVSKTALLKWRINVIKQSIAYDQYVRKMELVNRARASRNWSRQQVYKMRLAEYTRKKALHNQGRLVSKRTILKRERPFNPYSRVKSYDGGFHGYLTWYVRVNSGIIPSVNPNGPMVREWGFQEAKGQIFSYMFQKPALANALATETNNRCIFNLKRKKVDQVAHIGNIIAERHQTISYVSGKLKQLLAIKRNPSKFVKDFFGTRKNEKFSKNVSDEFLAIQFGVSPLAKEVYAAFQDLSKGPLIRDKLVLKSSVSSEDVGVFKQTVPATATGFGGYSAAGYLEPSLKEVTVTARVTTSYVLEYRVENGALDLLQRYGLSNPAEVLWEVMPWSFVVDWFLPIGDWIKSFNSSNLVFERGTKVVTTTTLYNGLALWDGHPHTAGGSNVGYHYKGKLVGHFYDESKVRTVLTAEPFTARPEFKNPFSFYHVLDTLALLRQRTK